MAIIPTRLIGGIYEVDFAHGLAGAAEGSTTFAAHAGNRGGLMAVQVVRGWPMRARELGTLCTGPQIPNLLGPLAHGTAAMPSGETGCFVICPAPPGPALVSALRPWPEAELIEHVLKPAALVLTELQARRLTHRSIRPGNVFQAAWGVAVTLGSAWAAPAASHQPAWIEPTCSAVCSACGRGDGSIADDVYALGALLVMLALGRQPLEGLTDEAVLLQKLELGSYAALVGSRRLPPAIADLARGMLADDPGHRPSPALLATPVAARARRIAARPIRRAQRPIEVGDWSVTTARGLAYALARDQPAGIAALRNGLVDRWLRRGLGDALCAGQLEEVVRVRDAQAIDGNDQADAALITSAVALLDPTAPLVRQSAILWPDGLGPALDHAMHHAPGRFELLADIVLGGLAERWDALRAGRAPPRSLDIRDLRSLQKDKRPGVAAWRLCYALNPLAPCISPRLEGSWVIHLREILPGLEAAMVRFPGSPVVLDGPTVAFIAARTDDRMKVDIRQLATTVKLEDAYDQLRLTAALQARLHPDPLPSLCSWAAEVLQPLIARFKSRSRRTQLATEIASLAGAGQLTPMLRILDETADWSADETGGSKALARLQEIDRTLEAMTAAEPRRLEATEKTAYDAASGLGAIALMMALAAALLG